MKYIVTGAAGLIGSATVWAMNQAGITDILAVDHLGTSEKWKNLRALKFDDYMEKDDFLDQVQKHGLPPGVEGIVHLGACSSTTETDATYLAKNNFAYTRFLAKEAVFRNVRFVYASSAATYGGGEFGYNDDDEGIEKLIPLNMYGYSKQMFDLWAKRNGYLDEIAGLKFTNIYGPNEAHKGPMRSMVCRAFEQIRDTGKVKLFKSANPDYEDGEFKRDFLYVKDAVDMVLHLLLKKPDAMGIFNVGSGRAETWNALAAAVFHAMKKPVKIEYIEMPEHLKDKYQYYTCAGMKKMQKTGYRKKVSSLESAIADYVQNYLIPDKHLGQE